MGAEMSHKPTILVTACGCPGGPPLIRALQPDFRVVGIDCDPQASGRFFADRFAVSPRGGPDLVEFLVELCRREAAVAVLPESSAEVVCLARARPRFEAEGILLLLANAPAVETAIDKIATYEALASTPIPQPRWFEVYDSASLAQALARLGFPKPNRQIIVKHPVGKGGRGVRVLVEEIDRMASNPRKWPDSHAITLAEFVDHHRPEPFGPYLFMEYLDGEETSADLFGLWLGFTKIRRHCEMAVPQRHESRYDPEIMRWGRIAVEALGLDYFVNVQFMDRKLMEINPRISTMLYCDTFNFPLEAVRLALGMKSRAVLELPDGVQAQFYRDQRCWGP